MTQDNTQFLTNFQSSVTPRRVWFQHRTARFRTASDEVSPKPPFSGLALVSCVGTLEIGPGEGGGVLSCVVYGVVPSFYGSAVLVGIGRTTVCSDQSGVARCGEGAVRARVLPSCVKIMHIGLRFFPLLHASSIYHFMTPECDENNCTGRRRR